VVAKVGTIFGSPAAELLTYPNERKSALERLKGVFRIGAQGQAYRAFVEARRKQGNSEAEIVREWRDAKAAVMF
jgi:hypothetical protein